MEDKEEGGFARSQAYRSLRSITKFYTGKEKNRVSRNCTYLWWLATNLAEIGLGLQYCWELFAQVDGHVW